MTGVQTCALPICFPVTIYAALTRASKGIIEIGDIAAMKYAVATMGDDNRQTWLKDLLVENDEKDVALT